MITGVQPTGNFTLGNYIGAIKNFVRLQKDYNSYIFIADLHGLTSYQNPKDIHDRILDLAALYMACGVEPKYTKFFVQSDVNEHSVLGFLIAFQCRIGELSRMTQYKSKKEKQVKDGIDLGLLIYPTLMAADILLYDASIVPVGKDQKQHTENTIRKCYIKGLRCHPYTAILFLFHIFTEDNAIIITVVCTRLKYYEWIALQLMRSSSDHAL